MRIEIEGDSVRLTGKQGKAIIVYHNEEDDSFSLSVCQNRIEHCSLTTITFYKNHTICSNIKPAGKSFIE